ncbi:glycoside hydrolase superfamily [Tribonema minus]|uniref:Glycoside hydrolase superfamily n=1 Tax=Tribonema minus TaxID=303371 RepID=A0A835YTW8_9STRA|nr:glycoside hydrolase superfamily [Tribonema minus]
MAASQHTQDGTACCPGTCGKCGSGDALHGLLRGAKKECFEEAVRSLPRPCDQYDPPCYMPAAPAVEPGDEVPDETPDTSYSYDTTGTTADAPNSDPYCVDGIVANSGSICCDRGCTLCGKPNCSTDALGADKCCGAKIKKSKLSCDKHTAPCAVNRDRPFKVKPNTIRRKTIVGAYPGGSADMTLYQRQAAYGMQFDAQMVYMNVEAAYGIQFDAQMVYMNVEAAYGMQFDAQMVYMNVEDMTFEWQVRPLLERGLKVQAVLEFYDNLTNIAAGAYDDKLKTFGADAAADGREVTIRMLHEFNGDWYSWCAFSPGNSVALFKQAFAHIVQVLRKTGGNFKFQLSYAAVNATPAGSTTTLKDFYTGLEPYVDEICVSAYNLCGVKYTTNRSLMTVLDPWYNQPQWIKDTWATLATKYTQFQTVNWFLENKPVLQRDWDLNTQADVDAFVAGFKSFKKATKVLTEGDGQTPAPTSSPIPTQPASQIPTPVTTQIPTPVATPVPTAPATQSQTEATQGDAVEPTVAVTQPPSATATLPPAPTAPVATMPASPSETPVPVRGIDCAAGSGANCTRKCAVAVAIGTSCHGSSQHVAGLTASSNRIDSAIG